MDFARSPVAWTTRCFISPAALSVNVRPRMFSPESDSSTSKRCRIRSVITRVLPVPAPAMTSSGPSRCVIARLCASFSFSPLSPSGSMSNSVAMTQAGYRISGGRGNRSGQSLQKTQSDRETHQCPEHDESHSINFIHVFSIWKVPAVFPVQSRSFEQFPPPGLKPLTRRQARVHPVHNLPMHKSGSPPTGCNDHQETNCHSNQCYGGGMLQG